MLCSLLLSAALAGDAAPLLATVDAAAPGTPLRRMELCQNTSLRFAPPHALAERVAADLGRLRIVRTWLCLDDLWDHRDGTYHDDFLIGRDRYAGDTVKSRYDRDRVADSGLAFPDYLRAWSAHSDEVLLNLRRYETEVRKGVITVAQWEAVVEHGLRLCKRLAPNLRWIEVGNEWTLPHFGGIDGALYYQLYQAANRVVVRLNTELQPAIPLAIGGPNVFGSALPAPGVDPKPGSAGDLIRDFLRRFAADPDPGKRLDFIAFHEYLLGNDPRRLGRYHTTVDAWCREVGLEPRPIFLTEIGIGHPKPDASANLAHGLWIVEALDACRPVDRLVPFPWVLYHAPVQQSLVAYDSAQRLTAFGALMQAMARDRSVVVPATTEGGSVVASRDDQGLSVRFWQRNGPARTVRMRLDTLPAGWAGRAAQVTCAMVDGAHGNVAAVPAWTGGLETVSTTDVVLVPGLVCEAALAGPGLVQWSMTLR
jgi:hypothetical protein